MTHRVRSFERDRLPQDWTSSVQSKATNDSIRTYSSTSSYSAGCSAREVPLLGYSRADLNQIDANVRCSNIVHPRRLRSFEQGGKCASLCHTQPSSGALLLRSGSPWARRYSRRSRIRKQCCRPSPLGAGEGTSVTASITPLNGCRYRRVRSQASALRKVSGSRLR